MARQFEILRERNISPEGEKLVFFFKSLAYQKMSPPGVELGEQGLDQLIATSLWVKEAREPVPSNQDGYLKSPCVF